MFVLRGEVEERIQKLRVAWDPVMAARIRPHVTLVYPEETVDEQLLLERVAKAAKNAAPFVVSLGEIEGSGNGGVWFPVVDSGTWAKLRTTILSPPFQPIEVTPHVTVVHPRTSGRSREAMNELAGTRIAGSIRVNEMLFTETSPEGMSVIQRFPLAGPKVRVVAGILRRGGRILLCHRHPERVHYPDVWDLPGGHTEAGEASGQTLARELSEELGITVAPPTGPVWMTLETDDLEMSVYLIDSWEGDPHNASPDEHDEIRWVTVDDLPALDLADPSYPEMLRRALP